MHGPFLLKLVTGRLLHDGRYVDWDRVRSVEENRILISGSADDLPRSAPPT